MNYHDENLDFSSNINSLAISEFLTVSGFSKKQSDAQATLLSNLFNHQIATKNDLHNVETRLEAKLSAKIDNLKADIFKWVVPIMTGQTALIVALVKFI